MTTAIASIDGTGQFVQRMSTLARQSLASEAYQITLELDNLKRRIAALEQEVSDVAWGRVHIACRCEYCKGKR